MKHINLSQRYKIQAFLQVGLSKKKISEELEFLITSIRREINRNCDKRSGVYKAELANKKCLFRHKEKVKNIRFTKEIKLYVDQYIIQDSSPEQIGGFAKKEEFICVSHQRIYQYIWANKLKGGTLYKHLRTGGKRYAKRGNTNGKRGGIPGRVDIKERPEIVDLKQRIGDLEMDLIIGKMHKFTLLTINNRFSGMLWMAIIPSKEALVIQNKTIDLLKDSKTILHTITTDNGKEFANYREISSELEIDYYFATPYHNWERGANENLNGLVRQYFKKGTDFDWITQQDVDNVVKKLNNRPRKRHDFKTPNEVYNEQLKKVA
jgi:IS30 family transposase